MKNNIKKYIEFFNEYGIVCLGIAFIIMFMLVISFAVVGVIVYIATFIFQLPFIFNLKTVAIIWCLCIIMLKLYAKKVERDIKENKV